MQYSRRDILAAGAGLSAASLAGCTSLFGDQSDWAAWATSETIAAESATMYHDPYCECCEEYADYFADHLAGELTVDVVDDPSVIKDDHGIPDDLRSCHTVLIDDTVFEGHLPVETIIEYRETEDGAGIALPGMPEHSPGMGEPADTELTVYHLDETVFTTV